MPFANSNTITDDVTLTLPHIAFEILCPCTKFHSQTLLYNAAASSPSRPHEGDSLATIISGGFRLVLRGGGGGVGRFLCLPYRLFFILRFFNPKQ